MAHFIDRLRRGFVGGTMLMKLVYINIAVFLLLRIGAMFIGVWGGDAQHLLLQWVELPSDPALLLVRPWTLLTYMFAQYDILHILFNMLWLYWFGQYFLILGTQRQLLAIYVYGGLGGALLYLLAMPVISGAVIGYLTGASAAVLAIVVATAWRMPDYKVGLLFFGEVALKWIATVAVAISLFNISGDNAGGNVAHIGGAAVGAVWAIALGHGRDLTKPFCRMMDKLVNLTRRTAAGRPRRRSVGPKARTASDNELNAILDKIRRSGYASLTKTERQKLFDYSNRL